MKKGMKKMVHKKKDKGLFQKLLLLFALIMLPLMIAQFLMYQWGKKTLTDMLTDSARSNQQTIQENFLSMTEDISYQMEILLSNYQISSFYVIQNTYTSSEYYMSIRQILEILSLVKGSNPYIEDIELYYVGRGIGLSTKTGILPAEFSDIEGRFAYWKPDCLLQDEESIYIGHSRPAGTQSHSLPLYYVRAILAEGKIQDLLSSFQGYSGQNTWMYNHNTDTMILGRNMSSDLRNHVLALKVLPSAEGEEQMIPSNVEIGGKRYTCFQTYLPRANVSFLQLIDPSDFLAVPNRYMAYMVGFSMLALLALAAFSYVMYRYIKRPVNDLMNAFQTAGNGNLETSVNLTYAYEYVQLSNDFNAMVKKLKEQIAVNYEQTILLQQAELKQLQSQINPHFLYNSFFLMRHMMNEEQLESARLFLQQLGEYYQYITRNHDNVVTLEQEYQHCSNYLAIQLQRFEDRLSAETHSLPAQYRLVQVPRLILQPVVENAIQHGIRNDFDTGMIHIGFRPLQTDPDHYLEILIEDNGNENIEEKVANVQKILAEDLSIGETTGIRNIHQRLKIFYQDGNCGLFPSKSQLGGLCISIVIRINQTKGEDACETPVYPQVGL